VGGHVPVEDHIQVAKVGLDCLHTDTGNSP
jgi:hypothetical protein